MGAIDATATVGAVRGTSHPLRDDDPMASNRPGITRDWVEQWAARYRVEAANTRWRPGPKFRVAMAKYPAALSLLEPIDNFWDLERHIFQVVGESVRTSGVYAPSQLLTVGYWKSNRPLRYYVRNRAATVATVTRAALAEQSPWYRLDQLIGVGIPVASALLTVWKPDEYTIIDVRALHTLNSFNEKADVTAFVDHDQPWWERRYDLYLKGCADVAKRVGLSLRTLDRALWKWGQQNA
jgi:hypothetical protein